jgi:hypothetical protein
MKLLNLLFLTFDDEFYVIDNISELEVRERLIARVGNEQSLPLLDTPEPLVGTVGKNRFFVWPNRVQVLGFRKIPQFYTVTTSGLFRNISTGNDRILLTLDFAVSFPQVILGTGGTGLFLFGLLSFFEVIATNYLSVVLMMFGFMTRVVLDLRSLAQMRRTREALLSAFKNKKMTRVSRVAK